MRFDAIAPQILEQAALNDPEHKLVAPLARRHATSLAQRIVRSVEALNIIARRVVREYTRRAAMAISLPSAS